ncbi:hypothetical protein Vadar_003630 [Vaccinium darrowii]|uniref:Uncharacterized protein n=1 Tax=Vaccinium darrowii TaxID=229202 RepID=A0ACB7YBG8_9ERIC|nr:hypothetical protein Vadar_003630 [Vaccinium darrowii]
MGSSSMTTSAPNAFFVCFVISVATFHICFCNGISSSFNPTHNNITCFENEREALVKFKQDLIDPLNRLSSWDTVGDCCRWAGVVCDNLTGHVHEIRLQNPCNVGNGYCEENPYLRGKVSPSLLDLKHLQYLDLSNNNFEGAPIPSFIGSIATLRYLDLSSAGFGGTIPPQLGNITTFRYLDLGDNSRLRAGNLQWLAGLVSLQHLNMSYVDLSKALDWLQVTSDLPSLVELHLSNCQLKHVVSPSSTNKINFTSLDILDLSMNDLGPSIPGWILGLNNLVSLNLRQCSFSGPLTCGLQNMTSLKVLELDFNFFNSTIPNCLYSLSHLESLSFEDSSLQGVISTAIENLTSLVSLDLASNQLQGSLPTSLGKLCKLKTIYLEQNKFSGEVADVLIGFSRCKSHMLEDFDISLNSFSGPIPMSIGRLSSLKRLDLSNNKFNGTIPESFGQLAKLQYLVVQGNTLEGVVYDVNFANLTRLRHLNAGGNSITLKTSENWVPPFQVEELNLDSWLLGPQFPLWLPSQRKLISLSLANTGISGSIPALFWPIFSKLLYADLSRNQICGEIPSLPNVEDSFSVIDLSSNRLNGSLPYVPSNLEWLDLSNNSFSGSIYQVLCGKGEELNKLSFLNLGNNLLLGNIPDCWNHWLELRVIILENNNLVGGIPSSMGQLQGLQSLHLRHNHLSGELPQTLQNCSSLSIVDLSENRFTGSIPPWMGNALLQLVVLDLRSNNFWGNLAYELCCLSYLQILDIAFNNISGHVPRCLANFSAMAEIEDSSFASDFYHVKFRPLFELSTSVFPDNAFLVTKGRDVEYSTTLRLVKSMDLSENKLSGEIPEELTKLLGLWSLNLSGNHLTGRIPRNIGDMRRLESVDFSRNQLSGVIPSSMSSLTFLSHLNLSYNNLTGTIPSSTQLQLMNESSFLGNKLCGPPLPRCKPNKTIAPTVVPRGGEEEGDGFLEALFFASIALGFAVGFWVVLGPLLFKRSWRIAYFKVIEDIWNKVCDFSFECRYMFRKRE